MWMRRRYTAVCAVLTVMLLIGCGGLSQLIATPTTPQVLQDGTLLVPGSGILNGKYAILDPRRLKIEGFTVTVAGDPALEESGVTVAFVKSR